MFFTPRHHSAAALQSEHPLTTPLVLHLVLDVDNWACPSQALGLEPCTLCSCHLTALSLPFQHSDLQIWKNRRALDLRSPLELHLPPVLFVDNFISGIIYTSPNGTDRAGTQCSISSVLCPEFRIAFAKCLGFPLIGQVNMYIKHDYTTHNTGY